MPSNITTLFLDIGGVLLTDGWQRNSRKRAVKEFRLDPGEMEDRHHMVFDTYEEGKLTLGEYLDWVVFYKERPFTRAQFRRFMFAQSKPYPEMIELVRQLKAKHGLKIIVLSNEARELNAYRIRRIREVVGRHIVFDGAVGEGSRRFGRFEKVIILKIEHVLMRKPREREPEVTGLNGSDRTCIRVREYSFISLFRACAESLASENASRLGSCYERAVPQIRGWLGADSP